MNPGPMVEQQQLATECSYGGTTVFGIQELLEELLKHLPPGAILRLQRVCKNWYYTMKTAHFKRLLFLLPVATTEVWDIDRRAAHGRTHGDRGQVVLGRRVGIPVSPPSKLPVPCKRYSSRALGRSRESTETVRVPIHFNPLIFDQRPEDKADDIDERASRHACAEVSLYDWGLRDEEPRPWHDMLLTQPACRVVRVQVLGNHQGLSGGHSALTDDFLFSEPEGVRLGQVVAAMKKRFSYIERGKVSVDYITIFVPAAIEVMEGDEQEIERRTKFHEEDMRIRQSLVAPWAPSIE